MAALFLALILAGGAGLVVWRRVSGGPPWPAARRVRAAEAPERVRRRPPALRRLRDRPLGFETRVGSLPPGRFRRGLALGRLLLFLAVVCAAAGFGIYVGAHELLRLAGHLLHHARG